MIISRMHLHACDLKITPLRSASHLTVTSCFLFYQWRTIRWISREWCFIFNTTCVFRERIAVYFWLRSVSSEAFIAINCLFFLLLLTAPPHSLSPDSHWPHVNYFVNPHNSFNWCGFVYPGDQIELGEIVGGCQPWSVRKTDECRSNSLTMGATVRHMTVLLA